MIKNKNKSEFDRLEALIKELCQKYHFTLMIDGWTRKTFDIFQMGERLGKTKRMARVESLAVSNGEIHYFDEEAYDFACELGHRLEKDFGIEEAVLIETAHD